MAKQAKKAAKLVKTYQAQGLLILLGLIAGWFIRGAQIPSNQANLIWAIDNTVNVPAQLESHLRSLEVCKEYQGPGTPNGVGLWAVRQVEQDRFAKISHGCSWSLNSYVLAINVDNRWQIIPKDEYFMGSESVGALPTCEVLKKYEIPSSIEPFCLSKSGKAQPNE